MKRDKVFSNVINMLFCLLSIAMLIPFLLVIAISFSTEQSLLNYGYQFIPHEFSVEAYQIIFKSPMVMINAYGVTTIVTIIGTIVGLLLTALTAYTISRRDFRYAGIFTFYIFFTMLFSGGLVPTYILMTQYLKVQNTLWAMILPGMLTPWNILIMKGFLSKIPFEMIESAKVDGAKEIRIFFTLILPLATPALATLGLLISFSYWNSWMPALLYIDKESMVPIQLLLVRILENIEFLTSNEAFQNGIIQIDLSEFPALSTRFALAIVAAGPMMVIFPFFQRYFVSGLTVGSLKG